MSGLTRRSLITGCPAAIAGVACAGLAGSTQAAAIPAPSVNQELLVVVFLRGGCDALSMVAPLSGPDRGFYEVARPTLRIPVENLLALDGQFGFHPSFAPLYPLYGDGKLAVVHAVGLKKHTRSHFDAQRRIELGTPGKITTTKGWLARHLATAPDPAGTLLLPALAAGSSLPTSLLGSSEAAVFGKPSNFALNGNINYRSAQRIALRAMYDGDHWLYQGATNTLDTMDVVSYLNPGTYVPANGAAYPSGSFGDKLELIAQMTKLGAGLRVATLDFGGWDTHTDQGDGGTGFLAGQVQELAQGLAALYADLDGAGEQNFTSRLTVVVHSEFGRRLRENANRGSDHGHGGIMLLLGGKVNGGAVYGDWPGLHPDQLYDGADLDITTDYRQVLAEIVMRRLQNPQLSQVFPGLTDYTPLGVVQGTDIL